MISTVTSVIFVSVVTPLRPLLTKMFMATLDGTPAVVSQASKCFPRRLRSVTAGNLKGDEIRRDGVAFVHGCLCPGGEHEPGHTGAQAQRCAPGSQCRQPALPGAFCQIDKTSQVVVTQSSPHAVLVLEVAS